MLKTQELEQNSPIQSNPTQSDQLEMELHLVDGVIAKENTLFLLNDELRDNEK